MVRHQQKPKHCISAGFLHLLALTEAWLSPEGSAQGSTFKHVLLIGGGGIWFLHRAVTNWPRAKVVVLISKALYSVLGSVSGPGLGRVTY